MAVTNLLDVHFGWDTFSSECAGTCELRGREFIIRGRRGLWVSDSP